MRGTPDPFRPPNRPVPGGRAGAAGGLVASAILIGSLIGAMLAGCEATPSAKSATAKGDAERLAAGPPEVGETRRGRTRGLDDPAGDADRDAPSAQALALRERADRDMEALRALRRKAKGEMESTALDSVPGDPPAGTPTRTSTRTPTHTRPAAVESRRPPIIWNETSSVASGTPNAPGDGGALARPEESTAVTPFAAGTLSPSEQVELNTLGMKLVQLRQDLYRESIDSEQPVRELLAIAAMAIVNPDLTLPQGADRSLTPDELELLEQLHHFFIELGRKLDDTHEAQETIVTAVLELQNAIVKKPQLELPTAALCWRIGGFGDYERFERNAFLAHDSQQVILYLEIDGFTSTLNQRGQWVTSISQQLEIFSDRDGIPVWSEDWQKAVDVINKQRRDFFTTQLITLPAALSVGKYQLKIRVRDEQSGAEAEESIPFDMVADPKIAARVGQ